MACAIEALGMSLPYSSSVPALDPAKVQECLNAGNAMRILLEQDIKPKDIMTRTAFENAMVVIMALGGSTNAVLHLLAMARAVDVPLVELVIFAESRGDDFFQVKSHGAMFCDLRVKRKFGGTV